MRRPVIALAVLALIVGGAACAKKLDTGFPSPTVSIPSPENTAPATAWTLSPQNIQWGVSKLFFEAGKKTTVTVDNKDTAPHNFALYDKEGGTELFKPDKDVQAGAKGDYTVPAEKAGTYYFQCDIHPSMKGTVEVS
jgi:plastocyanin